MTRLRLCFPLLSALLAIGFAAPAPLAAADDADASFRLLFGDKFTRRWPRPPSPTTSRWRPRW
jgi:hypothetical protein